MKQKFHELIKEAGVIGLSGHIRPDGDCIGALSALSQYIEKVFPGKKVDVFVEFVPESFRFLKNCDTFITSYQKKSIPDSGSYDLFISLDCGDTERLGEAERFFREAGQKVNIDHHISNVEFADYNHIEAEKSSTCEVLFSLFDEMAIDSSIAEALYLGIIHDTGVLKYSNTSRETLSIAGKLIEKDIPFSRIIDETFYQKTFKQNQLLGGCLLKSRLHLGGRVISSVIDQKTMREARADSSDLDGIVDQLRITKGVVAALFLHELEEQKIQEAYRVLDPVNGGFLPVYKVSMRVNDGVDVSRIAVLFGGGGHKKAAGCTIAGKPEDVLRKILKEIEKQLP